MRRHLRSIHTGAITGSAEERVVALVRARAGDVLAYLERRAASPQDAADVLGETLATAWRRVQDLPREDVAARMRLFATARMTLANYRRGHRRAQHLTARLREELETAHRATGRSGPDPATDAVHEALAELSEHQRELVTLVHWDGFTITEAGEHPADQRLHRPRSLRHRPRPPPTATAFYEPRRPQRPTRQERTAGSLHPLRHHQARSRGADRPDTPRAACGRERCPVEDPPRTGRRGRKRTGTDGASVDML